MTATLTGCGRYPDHSSPRASSQATSSSTKFWVSGSNMKSITAVMFMLTLLQRLFGQEEEVEEVEGLRRMEHDESAMSAGRKPTTDGKCFVITFALVRYPV